MVSATAIKSVLLAFGLSVHAGPMKYYINFEPTAEDMETLKRSTSEILKQTPPDVVESIAHAVLTTPNTASIETLSTTATPSPETAKVVQITERSTSEEPSLNYPEPVAKDAASTHLEPKPVTKDTASIKKIVKTIEPAVKKGASAFKEAVEKADVNTIIAVKFAINILKNAEKLAGKALHKGKDEVHDLVTCIIKTDVAAKNKAEVQKKYEEVHHDPSYQALISAVKNATIIDVAFVEAIKATKAGAHLAETATKAIPNLAQKELIEALNVAEHAVSKIISEKKQEEAMHLAAVFGIAIGKDFKLKEAQKKLVASDYFLKVQKDILREVKKGADCALELEEKFEKAAVNFFENAEIAVEKKIKYIHLE